MHIVEKNLSWNGFLESNLIGMKSFTMFVSIKICFHSEEEALSRSNYQITFLYITRKIHKTDITCFLA